MTAGRIGVNPQAVIGKLCCQPPEHCLQDLARLGRWMAGKAVGLVLSGGGSRGLAHLGVLHALDDAGVPVDIIGGTSQVSILLISLSHA